MYTATKPEGKYLQTLCKKLHIESNVSDDIGDRLQSAMENVLAPDEIELIEDKYLRKMTVAELAYKHDTKQMDIDTKIRGIKAKIFAEITKE